MTIILPIQHMLNLTNSNKSWLGCFSRPCTCVFKGATWEVSGGNYVSYKNFLYRDYFEYAWSWLIKTKALRRMELDGPFAYWIFFGCSV